MLHIVAVLSQFSMINSWLSSPEFCSFYEQYNWRIGWWLSNEIIQQRQVKGFRVAWCRHQMETFSALLALCAGNSSVTGEFPSQRPVTQSFDIFFDFRLNTRLSKQSWGWWFERTSWSLWRHCNGLSFAQRKAVSNAFGLAQSFTK